MRADGLSGRVQGAARGLDRAPDDIDEHRALVRLGPELLGPLFELGRTKVCREAGQAVAHVTDVLDGRRLLQSDQVLVGRLHEPVHEAVEALGAEVMGQVLQPTCVEDARMSPLATRLNHYETYTARAVDEGKAPSGWRFDVVEMKRPARRKRRSQVGLPRPIV